MPRRFPPSAQSNRRTALHESALREFHPCMLLEVVAIKTAALRAPAVVIVLDAEQTAAFAPFKSDAAARAFPRPVIPLARNRPKMHAAISGVSTLYDQGLCACDQRRGRHG